MISFSGGASSVALHLSLQASLSGMCAIHGNDGDAPASPVPLPGESGGPPCPVCPLAPSGVVPFRPPFPGAFWAPSPFRCGLWCQVGLLAGAFGLVPLPGSRLSGCRYPSPGVCAFRPWGPSARAAHRFLAPHVRLGLCHPPFPFAVGPFTCGAASARGWEPSGLGAVWALLRGVRRLADPGARLDWAVV